MGAPAVARKQDVQPRAAPEKPGHKPPAHAHAVAGATAGVPLFLQRSGIPGKPCAECAELDEDAARQLGVQPSLRVGAPNDPLEREADIVAQRAVSAGSLEDDLCAGCSAGGAMVQRAVTPVAAAATYTPRGPRAGAVSRYISRPGGGTPLPTATRHHIEPHVGASLGHVRVHDGPHAGAAAAALGARAFTHSSNIFLGAGESAHDVRLMAHESTHVVQQGAAAIGDAPIVQRNGAGFFDDPLGVLGEGVSAVGEGVTAVGEGISDVAGEIADTGWAAIEYFAPEAAALLREIMDRGIVGWLYDKLTSAIGSLLGTVTGDEALVEQTMQTFDELEVTVTEVTDALASGDCEPLFSAMGRLWEIVSTTAGEVWTAISDFFAPIGEWFSDMWTRFGAPVVDWIGEVAGDVWDAITQFATDVWDSTQPVRDAAAAAWDWLKNQLGIGEGEEGQDGLLQWVQRKLGEAWDEIYAEFEPIIAPIQGVVQDIVAVLPLDGIQSMRDSASAWLRDFGQMAPNLGAPNDAVANQDTLRDQILPAILGTVATLRTSIISAGQWVSERVGSVVTAIVGVITSMRDVSLTSVISGVLDWVESTASRIGSWAQGVVVSFFAGLGDALVNLASFIEPVLGVLRQIISVVADVVGQLASLVFGFWWNLIPACIRDPIKDFIIDKILRNIPIISTFLDIPDIWAQIQARVLDFLHRVFVQGDLSGAVMMVVRFVLEAVGVDVNLFLSILSNAADAIDRIIMDPIGFMSNLFGALMEGFGRFASNIWSHLVTGLIGWLTGPLQDMGITPPTELTLRSVLDLVLQIIGVSADRLWEKAQEKVTEMMGGAAGAAVATVRLWVDRVWGWVQPLIAGGLGGLWEEIQSQLSNLWDTVIGGITSWISVEVVEAGIEWLAKLSQPVGWVAGAIKLIYDVVSFFVNKINQILQVVNAVVSSTRDIAMGNISGAAAWIEGAIARSVPTVIGFLASLLGIGDPAPSVRDIVTRIREQVDAAIDWLMERAIGIVQGVAGLFGGGEEEGEMSPSDAIKQRAQDEVMSRLTAEHTEEEAREIIQQIFTELQPEGLVSLETGPEDEEGEFEILAAASQKSALAKMKKKLGQSATMLCRVSVKFHKAVSVTAALPANPITLQVAPAGQSPVIPATPATKRRGARPEEDVSGGFVPFGVGASGPGGPEQAPTGSAILLGPGGAGGTSEELRMRSWNSGNLQLSDDNLTHAEHQAIAWVRMLIADHEMAVNIKHMEFQNLDLSPCGSCCIELKSLMEDVNERHESACNLEGITAQTVTGRITWSKQFISRKNSDLTTTLAKVGEYLRQWEYAGPVDDIQLDSENDPVIAEALRLQRSGGTRAGV